MNREPMTETMHEIAVYGAGGLGREICCLLRRINAATDRPRRFVGFFDDGLPSGSSNDYGPVLGGLERRNAWEPAHFLRLRAPEDLLLRYSHC